MIRLRPNSYAQERWHDSTAPVKVWSSHVGKGKSYGVCMDAIDRCVAIPGYKAAITRQTRVSLRESIQETLVEILGADLFLEYWSPTTSTLNFPPVLCDDGRLRRSKIVLFGWSDPAEALSTQYGLIAIEQAEQCSRQPLAFARTRIRHGDEWMLRRAAALGIRAQQIGLVCNADDPEHWLNLDFEIEDKGMRVERDGKTGAEQYEVILSSESDNQENLTDEYRDQLEALKGTVWYDRLARGRWVRAEGLVFGQVWNPVEHIVQRPAEWTQWAARSGPEAGKPMPPPSLPRHRWLDFGVNHPFTCTWGVEYPDGTVIAYREISGTGKAPSEWAELINELERHELDGWRAGVTDEAEAARLNPYLGSFECSSSVSDTELGWRTELARGGVWTDIVEKDIKSQVAVVTAALRENRINFVSDLLVEPDARLVRDKLPVSVLQEMGRYKWRSRPDHSSEAGEGRYDVPIDRDNHRIDPLGYFLTHYRGAPQIGVW